MHQRLRNGPLPQAVTRQEEKLTWLGKAEIFSSLATEQLRFVASESAFHYFRKEEPVFQDGDPGDSLSIVTRGTVEIFQQNGQGGAPTVIAELVAGDTFGELDLLTGSKRNATAVAGKDCRLLIFPRRGRPFEALLRRSPEVSAQLLFISLKTMTGRIRNTNALIKGNSPWVQELRRQVYGDKLSGLYNKTYLEEHLPGLLSDPSKPVSLLMIKPDNFKYINDTHGHEAGDKALRIMALDLRGRLGASGVAARYMGNEMALMLVGAGGKEANDKAMEVRHAFNELDLKDVVGADPVRLSVSIGIACYPEHAATADDLIAAAHALPLVDRSRGGNLILFPEDA